MSPTGSKFVHLNVLLYVLQKEKEKKLTMEKKKPITKEDILFVFKDKILHQTQHNLWFMNVTGVLSGISLSDQTNDLFLLMMPPVQVNL